MRKRRFLLNASEHFDIGNYSLSKIVFYCYEINSKYKYTYFSDNFESTVLS